MKLFMLLAFLLLAFLLIIPSVQTDTIDLFEDETHFQALQRTFEKESKNVSFEEAQGFYVGRCYDARNPEMPLAAVLGIYKRSTDHHGRGFSASAGIKKVLRVRMDGHKPNHFDNTPRNDLINLFDNRWYQHPPPEDICRNNYYNETKLASFSQGEGPFTSDSWKDTPGR